MVEFDAIYFDGRSSARRPVRVQGDGHRLSVAGGDVSFAVPLAEVRWVPPVTGNRHALHLPAGAMLQTEDASALASLFPGALRAEGWLRKLESRWTYALGAVAVIALIATWTLVYGVPIAAKLISEHLPPGVENELEDQTLKAIGRLCSPSALSPGRQEAIQRRLATLAAGLPAAASYRVELRSCGTAFGPNAFALPGSTIVVTDELVTLAQNDDEISAVLAHEVGHVLHRHSMRMALQGAGVAALVTALAGDAVSITALSVAIPTVLLETGYSRQFEEEADDFAFRRLKEVGLSPRHFAAMIGRLEEHERRSHGASAKGDRGTIDYLSTHPATERRIERALAAGR